MNLERAVDKIISNTEFLSCKYTQEIIEQASEQALYNLILHIFKSGDIKNYVSNRDDGKVVTVHYKPFFDIEKLKQRNKSLSDKVDEFAMDVGKLDVENMKLRTKIEDMDKLLREARECVAEMSQK